MTAIVEDDDYLGADQLADYEQTEAQEGEGFGVTYVMSRTHDDAADTLAVGDAHGECLNITSPASGTINMVATPADTAVSVLPVARSRVSFGLSDEHGTFISKNNNTTTSSPDEDSVREASGP